MKLNMDASVCNSQGVGGGMLQDHEGKINFAFYKDFEEVDILIAENLALLHGLQLCSMNYRGKLLVEVDSESLVTLVKSGCISKWPLCNFLWQIHALLKDLSTSIVHIFREANSSADKLVGSKLWIELYTTSFANLPGETRAATY
ncbi:uncharacterized protein LOC113769236 [Coffea eugenioides]|uniref:uncharacterized protein LOC113769236 n=1 Tax=Coffea eugenioides TaxID=49369 RepID=UPI000F615B18|nr:uncharacterized protein LOC113769236 [Coffea eugenioides]